LPPPFVSPDLDSAKELLLGLLPCPGARIVVTLHAGNER
jgi:hypothetical protein